MEEETIIETHEEEETITEETKKDYLKKEGKEETKEKTGKKSYVAERVDRAKEQAETDFLKELGYASKEDLQKALEGTEENKKMIQDIAKQIEQDKETEVKNKKKNLLMTALEEENVFDAEVLIPFVDLDKVEIENNSIKDKETIIETLKAKKPNFFGQEYVKTDTHTQSKGTPTGNEYKSLYDSGDYVSVINKYLNDKKII